MGQARSLQFFKIESKGKHFVFEEAGSQYHVKENSYFIICWDVFSLFLKPDRILI